MKSISIENLVKYLKLEVIYMPEDTKIRLINSELIRPGMQLAGYFDLFTYERIQILGKTEMNYLKTLNGGLKINRIDKLFSYPIPALIVTSNQKMDETIVYCAKKHKRPLLRTKDRTSKLVSNLINYLEDKLAPEIIIHGVFVEVFGIGVLIKGKSGIGKSETALELIKRGHRLISDDAVQLRCIDNALKGTSPELTRYLMEIRGIGILDIKHLYGVGSVRTEKKLEIIIELEEWNDNKQYDRLGLDENFEEMLDVKIPKLIVPVKHGRNIAMIIEVASKNHRQKSLGYNAAETYNNRFKTMLRSRDE